MSTHNKESQIAANSLLSQEIGLSWLVLGRVCLLSFALIAAAVNYIYTDAETSYLFKIVYLPFAILFLFSVLSSLWIKRARSSLLFSLTQLTSDALVITAIIYVTGGAISPFLFLYLPLIMTSAVLFSRSTALLLSVISAMAYISLVVCMLNGIIPPADGSVTAITPTSGTVLQIIGLCSAMVLIAVATSFLVSRLRTSTLYVEQSRKDLLEMGERHQFLINNIPDGIVTTGLDLKIININQTAQELLGLPREALLHWNIMDVMAGLNEVAQEQSRLFKELARLPNESNVTARRESKFIHPIRNEELKIVIHGHSISSSHNRKSGYLFVLQDVTKLRSVEGQLEMQERMARILARKDDVQEQSSTPLSNFVGESPVMLKVFRLIDRVAVSDVTVLINGESGTGKELVAKAIHYKSARAGKPFVPVNCGAIPENLIESELFGHKRGSFTGAEADYAGLFRQAQGGTIFLDEIGELASAMQAKLLRVIQERQVRPIGADRDISIDVRIIAATNKNLKREIEIANFREDLYYRLNVISINLPPLRDRKEDIPLLTHAILRRFMGKDVTAVIPPATMQLLLDYDYPGNVRELENLLERAHVLGGEVILPEHLPDVVRNYRLNMKPTLDQETNIIIDERISLPVNLDDILGQLERKYLEVALLKSNGAKKKAADLLGVNFRSFRYRLQKFGISDE